MNLTDIYNALAGVENGDQLKTFLKGFISDKDALVSQTETKLATAETRLKTLSETLGTTPDELENAAKEVKNLKKELDLAKKSVEVLTGEKTQLENSVKDFERKDKYSNFAAIVGADRDVILDLLPDDLELVLDEVDDNGKKRKRGAVKKGNEMIEFADYIDSHEKLSKYKAAIFTQQQNPPLTPTKLPAGKGSDRPTSETAEVSQEMHKKYRAPVIDKIKERFKR